ncbi:MAG: dihydrofolate reductase, partial [Bacteroidaceae bacterium]|nr:dihydrofolate reductase [Bacteroidaceae bacterium]
MALTVMMTGSMMSAAAENDFKYADERFADLQMLRYKVPGFENLSLKQKTFIYYLQEAALWGRDILWDQNCRYNLRVRRVLEEVYKQEMRFRTGNEDDKEEFQAFETYLKRVWFSNGIHHHYGCDKFQPEFSSAWFRNCVLKYASSFNDVQGGLEPLLKDVCEVIFNPYILQKRINLAEGVDLIKTSASNYYSGVTQAEAEAFYEKQKAEGDALHPVMYGMNSRLVKDSKGRIYEKKWTVNGLYGSAIKNIVDNLLLAREYAEDQKQKEVIDLLVSYYRTGDLKTFDDYSIAWAGNTEPLIDFVNGFIE